MKVTHGKAKFATLEALRASNTVYRLAQVVYMDERVQPNEILRGPCETVAGRLAYDECMMHPDTAAALAKQHKREGEKAWAADFKRLAMILLMRAGKDVRISGDEIVAVEDVEETHELVAFHEQGTNEWRVILRPKLPSGETSLADHFEED